MLHQAPEPQLAAAFSAAVLLALSLAAPVQAQNDGQLEPGDVLRVDRDFVGTLMSIDGAGRLTVLGEGKPRCWPGVGHGEAPRCDPAPPVRRIVEWRDATVERQVAERSHTGRTILGFVLGGAALAPVGYATGPSLGYGKAAGCIEREDIPNFCAGDELLTREELAIRQRSQDQTRGAFVFAILGGTIGAVVARHTIDEWVEIQPPTDLQNGGAWSLSVRLPAQGSN